VANECGPGRRRAPGSAEIVAPGGQVHPGVGVADRGLRQICTPPILFTTATRPPKPMPNVMVDLQPCDVLDGLDQQARPRRRPAPRVDLVVTVTGNVHVGVTRDADQHRAGRCPVCSSMMESEFSVPWSDPTCKASISGAGQSGPAVRAGDQPVGPRRGQRGRRQRDVAVQLAVQPEVGPGDARESARPRPCQMISAIRRPRRPRLPPEPPAATTATAQVAPFWFAPRMVRTGSAAGAATPRPGSRRRCPPPP